MYNTSGVYTVCRLHEPIDRLSAKDLNTRVDWLKGELVRLADTRAIARQKKEDDEAMSMLSPISSAEAFRWFGLFLGLLPPAAIFLRMYLDGFSREGAHDAIILVFIIMNFVCAVVGRLMGGCLGKAFEDTRQRSWLLMLLAAFFLGTIWGVVTGAAGGAIVVLIGAIIGVVCAAPIGMAAFLVFATFHRVLSRDGMIEQRNVWPLAVGVPGIIAAAILGA